MSLDRQTEQGRRWAWRGLLLGWMIWLMGADVRAQVAINEIMFFSSGSEFYDEYIELCNIGGAPIDLSGWRIGDGDEINAIVDAGQGLVLKPGQFGLVMDSGYFGNSTHYDPLPGEALVLTVDSATLGRDGLSNTRPERIVLISASGDTMGAMTYQPGHAPGISEEKIDPLGGDGPENWTDAKWVGGTPGRTNSVSRKDRDIALRLLSDMPVRVPWGQGRPVDMVVVNVGRQDVEGFRVVVQNAGDAVVDGGFLASGDSVHVSASIGPLPFGRFEFRAFVEVSGDQDPTNHEVAGAVVAGAEPGQVVINEVMAIPDAGAPEWLELWNRSQVDVDLAGWTLSDPVSTGRFGEGARISAGGYAIVAEGSVDTFHVHNLSLWPRLNDGGDEVVLRDATDGEIDRVVYPGAVRGISLERIDPLGPGVDAQNWLASVDPKRATPGAENSVGIPGVVEGVRLLISPNPFDDQATIAYYLPVPRAHVHLWVYDRTGRKVKTLLAAAEGGGHRSLVWDGRGDHGLFLKPGIYVLYLEAGTSAGAVFRARETVVLARGL